jgi:hypothetical protein
MRIKWKAVEPGDYLTNQDVLVTEVYNDPEGLWVETSDGECGYIMNPGATVEVER